MLTKVLVTGASGFIGRYVLARLAQHGISTVVAGRSRPDAISAEDFMPLDLLAQDDLANVLEQVGATHLLHLAWYAEHGQYWTSPFNLRWVEATVRLVEAFCAAGGEKVVVAGTCAEYDWSYGYCREESTPLNPATLYGTAKDATRRLLMAISAQYQVPCVWGRIFLPFGPGEDSRRLLPSLIEVFKGNRAPFGVNATAYRDFLAAEDLAVGFVRLLQGETAGVYNLCSGQPVQIAEVVRLVANVFKSDPKMVLDLSTERPGEPPLLVGDNHKLKALGWQHHESLESILSYVER